MAGQARGARTGVGGEEGLSCAQAGTACVWLRRCGRAVWGACSDLGAGLRTCGLAGHEVRARAAAMLREHN